MVEIGKYNRLKVVKMVDFGLYLDGGELGEILLPARYVPEGATVGAEIAVFLYLDSEERLVATTLRPKAVVGEFAWLQVAWANSHGAFLDWGLMKDLFVPFAEQQVRMRNGQWYAVYLYIDAVTHRPVASSRIKRFLSKERPNLHPGDEVEVLLCEAELLGYKAIVNNAFAGMIYHNEVFTDLASGMRLKAYVKQVREDRKIDLTLSPRAAKRVADFSDVLLQYLQAHAGKSHITDAASPDEIYQTFGVSKKTFKQAVGRLYKQQLIVLEPNCIKLK